MTLAEHTAAIRRLRPCEGIGRARHRSPRFEQVEAEVQGLRVELHTLREFDSLTGLPNRSRFMGALRKELGRARRYNRPLSVVLVDLDSFTELNAEMALQCPVITEKKEPLAES